MAKESIMLGPFIKNKFGDRYIYEVNRSAFDRVGSDTLYRQILSKAFFQEDTLNIVLGTDSGMLPKYVLKHGVPKGSRFLFLELSEIIERINQSVPLDLNPQEIVIATYHNWKQEAEKFNLTDYIFINRVLVQQSVGAMDANIPEYNELFLALSEELNQLVWGTQISLGTQAFVERQLENLAENRISSLCLKDAFKGNTAVLLGGGPSLDEIIPWLKSNQRRVVIIAVSRICRRLLECGLTPHIVFSVDPQLISFDISKELFHFWKETLFIHAFHVSSPLLAQWQGRSLFLGPRFPWNSPLNIKTLSSMGPTVSNAALASAVEMGFSQVLLAGVDLCFSRDGYSHAKGSNEYRLGPELGRRAIRVETNAGWTCETTPDYASAIQIIAEQAKQAKIKGCKVINTASSAAKIPNIVYQPIDEISIKDIQRPPQDIISDMLPIDDTETRVAYYHDILNELTRGVTALKDIRKLAIEALKCNDGLFGRKGRRADFSYKRRMDKIEKKLNHKYKKIVPLVKQFGIRSFLRIVHPDADREWDNDEIERAGKIYYESYRDSANCLIKLVKQAEHRLHERLEEEKEVPNIDLLIKQWQVDQQPGRYLVWKNHNPDAFERVTPIQKEVLKGLEDEFLAIMQETETRHMRLIRANFNLSGVRSKAAILFAKGGLSELERMGNGLSKVNDPKAGPLLCIVNGYIAELQGNFRIALDEYSKLISDKTDKILLEDALRRVASLCIENRDIENAFVAIQCLTGLSYAYAPQYADILRLMGNKQEAIKVYSEYLQMVPDDLTTMLKLGRLYKELCVNDAACMAFNYVLEHDPDNTAARTMLES
ncbi:MAG: DUF115 domain-containing protein [Nitrospiraceae bacterium]|nr:DUF115 domain-containing protein [Nitrospiraceae bacterium]